MPKKFDEISPKKISETKFKQLLASLPSTKFVDSGNEETNFKSIKTDKSPEKLLENESLDKKHAAKPPNTNTSSILALDVFVYECEEIRFGIPVQYVTEITNDFGNVSPLTNFIRSCTGTIQYRGRLLPIFDSEALYRRTEHNGGPEVFLEPSKIIDSIITINYENVMFALTMQNHIGIIEVAVPEKSEDENELINLEKTDLLSEIVGYDNQNLFLFSPQKIAHLVFEELRNQIVIDSDHNDSILQNTEAVVTVDFMLARIKDSTVAIEITKVVEVIEGFEVTPLYKVSDYIRGLINLRGQVLACIDLALYLGYDYTVIDERNKFIVLRVEEVEFALCIDDSLGIESIDPSNFQSSDKVFKSEIYQFFPDFVEQKDLVKLIFRPELFLKEPDLFRYK